MNKRNLKKMYIYKDGSIFLYDGKELIKILWNPTLKELEEYTDEYEVIWK